VLLVPNWLRYVPLLLNSCTWRLYPSTTQELPLLSIAMPFGYLKMLTEPNWLR